MPGELMDARFAQSSSGGFPGNRAYWESVIAVPRFRDGNLDEVRLYPIVLGFGNPRPQRGSPAMADDETGRRIIEEVQKLSEAFGVRVEYDAAKNVGVIKR